METTKTEIRWMNSTDWPAVLRIDRLVSLEPVTYSQLARLMKERKVVGQVIENGDCQVLGFMVYELLDGAFHIVQLAIDPASQRQGLGRQLLDRLISKLGQRRRVICCQVPESELGTQLWLKACGARCVGIATKRDREPRYLFEIEMPSRA